LGELLGSGESRGPGSRGSQLPAPRSLILDGELLAHDPADPRRALPFKAFQRRLGRKAPDATLLAEVPAQLVVYDTVAWDGALVIDEPWSARRARLEAVAWPAPAVRLAGTGSRPRPGRSRPRSTRRARAGTRASS
jgi:hypothetical protein